MKKKLGLFVLFGILFFQSCITSLHPLYTANTEVFDAALIGLWQEDKESILIEKAPKGGYYKLTYKGENEPAVESETHLVKIGEHYYFDFKRWYDSDYQLGFNVFAPSVDVHNFARVVWDDHQIQMYIFDGEKIEKLLEQRRARIKHERLEDGQFILTAKAEELQQFVLKYGDELLDMKDPLIFPKMEN